MNKFLIGLSVLLAGVAVGWYSLRLGKPAPKTSEGIIQEVPVTPGEEEAVVDTPAAGGGDFTEKGAVVATATVSYTDSGFSPKTITVKKGTTVTFVNAANAGMWVASDVHPTHQLLPGFDQLKSVGKGGTYEYTFIKIGTWKYHNHVKALDTGTVMVTE